MGIWDQVHRLVAQTAAVLVRQYSLGRSSRA
jgi:hypothetical protein